MKKINRIAAAFLSAAMAFTSIAAPAVAFADVVGPVNQNAINAINPNLAYLNRFLDDEPEFNDEWKVLDLAVGGYNVSPGFYEYYYANIIERIEKTKGELEDLTKVEEVNNTTFSRLLITLASMGKLKPLLSSQNYKLELFKKYSDINEVIKQGINGPSWALIALDSVGAEVPVDASLPTGAQASKQAFVDYILSKELLQDTTPGGWRLDDTSAFDVDLTAMAIYALAPYYSQAPVKAAVDRAFARLSAVQLATGGFASWGTENSESIVQVICALVSVGRDPQNDPQFIKNGKSLLDALLTFRVVSSGGFKHTLNQGSANSMASEQSAYGLMAYKRFVDGGRFVFDFTQVPGNEIPIVTAPDPEGDVTISLDPTISGKQGTEFIAKAIITKPIENKLAIEAVFDIPQGVSCVEVLPGPTLSGGAIMQNLSDGKLRVVYMSNNYDALNNISIGEVPQTAFLIKLKLDSALAENSEVTISASSFRTLGALSTEVIYDISNAQATTKAVGQSTVDPVPTARVLYTGDGMDLIPTTTKAIAVSFAGLTETPEITYGDLTLYYSPELSLTNKTYVAITDSSLSLDEMGQWGSYSASGANQSKILFGDANDDNFINSQDALKVLSDWLRKTDAPSGKGILLENVTADGRIDTVDVLAIVENYVSGTPFAVLSK